MNVNVVQGKKRIKPDRNKRIGGIKRTGRRGKIEGKNRRKERRNLMLEKKCAKGKDKKDEAV